MINPHAPASYISRIRSQLFWHQLNFCVSTHLWYIFLSRYVSLGVGSILFIELLHYARHNYAVAPLTVYNLPDLCASQLGIRQGLLPHLPGCGVGVDGNLARASPVAIHRGCHFLPMDQSFYFISGRHKLSAFGFLERFINEEGVFFHLGSWKLFPYPRRQTLHC